MPSELRPRARHAPPEIGRQTDAARGDIVALIAALETEHDRLQALGCEALNGPHFKAGTRKMYFRRPADMAGRRAQVYIGTDPDKQAAALGRQHREHLRADIAALHDRLAGQLAGLDRALDGVHSDFIRAVYYMDADVAAVVDSDADYEPTAADNARPCPACGQAPRDRLVAPQGEVTLCPHCNHIERP